MKRLFLTSTAAAIAMLAACGCKGHAEQDVPLRVGITTSYSAGGGRITLGDSYVESVRRGGNIAFALPLVHSAEQAAQVLESMDVLLLTGGEDVDPRWYGEEKIGECVHVNAIRDTSDMHYARAAVRRGMKILAICRGEQLLNVAMGGTLFQDLPSQYIDTLAARGQERPDSLLIHRQAEPGDQATQTIYIDRTSVLYRLLGTDTAGINTFHHEAVKDIAPGLKVIARTPDGMVEAYEGNNILGLQFHPEKFVSAGQDLFLPVFEFRW